MCLSLSEPQLKELRAIALFMHYIISLKSCYQLGSPSFNVALKRSMLKALSSQRGIAWNRGKHCLENKTSRSQEQHLLHDDFQVELRHRNYFSRDSVWISSEDFNRFDELSQPLFHWTKNPLTPTSIWLLWGRLQSVFIGSSDGNLTPK